MRKIYFSFLALFVSICSMAQIAFPLDFEGAGPYAWTNFGEIGPAAGAVTTVITNPQSVGINTSAKVAQTVKGPGGQPYAGSWIQFDAPIDFSTNKYINMKVFSKVPGLKVLLKVENKDNAGINSGDVFATTTLTNAWEDLSFNFTTINVANSYQKLVVIFRLGEVGDGTANFTFHFDDIRQAATGAALPSLPLTFELASSNYAFVNFDGGAATVIANPQSSGINTSNNVTRLVKGAPGPWAGTKLFMNSLIDFTTLKTFRMKVFSPKAGAVMMLKFEGGTAMEATATVQQANVWEDLTFNYVNTNNTNNQVVIIPEPGTPGDGSANSTFLVDDIRQEATAGGGLTQMTLPVTFDDAGVNYGVVGFGEVIASIITVTDPPAFPGSTKVAKVIKPANAAEWAGTTITAPGGTGFSPKIPFAPGSTTMNVKVWSPDAGIKVRLKAEVSGTPSQSVETDATTTVAGGWENLVFNFANQATGTAAINFAFNYNLLSIFMNYGVTGAVAGEKTYYFDNVVFGATPLPVRLLSFDAKKEQTAVAFAWTTAQEVNNKGFAVQRSQDGQKWTNIAEIAGNGTRSGTHTYTAKDVLPIAGLNYYRLKQEDFDGASVYSSVKVIDFSGMQLDAVKVYPNPAKNSLNVVSAAFAGRVSYTIQSAEGRQVTSGNMNQTLSAQPIDISKLKSGIYYMVLRDGTTTQTVKFMVK